MSVWPNTGKSQRDSGALANFSLRHKQKMSLALEKKFEFLPLSKASRFFGSSEFTGARSYGALQCRECTLYTNRERLWRFYHPILDQFGNFASESSSPMRHRWMMRQSHRLPLPNHETVACLQNFPAQFLICLQTENLFCTVYHACSILQYAPSLRTV